MSLVSNLLGRRVILVTGKGGTGKTSFCAALGLLASRRGLRVLIVELNGACGIAARFGAEPRRYDFEALADGLLALSVSAQEALEEFVSRQLHSKTLFKLVFRNRITAPFIDAVPGLPEVIQLGKIYDLVLETSSGRPRFDLVIVDAPSTGHGVSLLDAPRAMLELTRVGPIFHNTSLVDDLFSDPGRTALVFTTLPEMLPTSEVIELFDQLAAHRRQVAAVVVNQVWPLLVDDDEAMRRWRGALGDPPEDDAIRRWMLRTASQRSCLERLSHAVSCPVGTLPYLFTRDMGRPEIATLADALEGLG